MKVTCQGTSSACHLLAGSYPVSHTPHLPSAPVQQDRGLSCCCTCVSAGWPAHHTVCEARAVWSLMLNPLGLPNRQGTAHHPLAAVHVGRGVICASKAGLVVWQTSIPTLDFSPHGPNVLAEHLGCFFSLCRAVLGKWVLGRGGWLPGSRAAEAAVLSCSPHAAAASGADSPSPAAEPS